MANLFISQQWIDNANMQEQITLDQDSMRVISDGKKYRLEPAVRFLAVEGGEGDPQSLVGKIKTEDQLTSMGAEKMAESVIAGDTAYRVQPGFVAVFEGAGNPISMVFPRS